MLENILHFHRLPPQQVQQAQQARQAQQAPRWRSDRPLSDAEREFVGAVIEHRRERLLHKIDDKVPIPYGVVVPARFRPRDSAGFALKRPYKTRNGMPHNLGRQFFSNFKSEDESGFVWADGTEAFSAAAGERFLDWAEDTGAAALLVHPGGVEMDPDFERKPAGNYKIGYAPTGRATCQGCKELIEKGTLRQGVEISIDGCEGWWKWRHWECVTNRLVSNMVGPRWMVGFEDLEPEDQARVADTFAVPPEPKPLKAPARKKAKVEAEAEEVPAGETIAAIKPKRKPRGKAAAATAAAAEAATEAATAVATAAAQQAVAAAAAAAQQAAAAAAAGVPPELLHYFSGPMGHITLMRQMAQQMMPAAAAAPGAAAAPTEAVSCGGLAALPLPLLPLPGVSAGSSGASTGLEASFPALEASWLVGLAAATAVQQEVQAQVKAEPEVKPKAKPAARRGGARGGGAKKAAAVKEEPVVAGEGQGEEAPAPAARRTRGKRVVVTLSFEEEEEEVMPLRTTRRTRGQKAAAAPAAGPEGEAPAAAAKKAPARRLRKKRGAEDEDDEWVPAHQ
ncbi:subunit of cis-Golgi transport vesicle tethering complex -Sec34p isoform D [Micractinium conductrix]|nr:subunit of cis-Golgi transport vesicle tethering complex -Sec34p isoform A [Micractinium conductrix]PSC71254.1 subunit of cis-Golgi transport vesicle tethering complex -Sec34p isoform B [Micractinium conductrix]PSC71255.1 subunit of cis-Golgi transport vesicle tethering complex -Sec34p isoform D [Micractinium conductrix]|eukprot:PSC71253.1 subunit of cis-Golgi transport vesicle tethering complex -Sec34p isoform A [Micractinium conductrix]